MAEETEAVASETVEEAAVEDEALKEAAISMEIGPEINWEVADREPEAKDPVNSELSVVRNMHQSEEKADIPGVDAKYSYLCGKKLLEDIDIEDMLYEKGTIINADLIKHAIGNNAIVKVIVSAEE
jgi:hypothetical protein